jgi:hypothetical protein
MPRVKDFLSRFRPIGTPGAAAKAGVPADRAVEAADELEPLFAMLADTEAEVDRIRTSAETSIAEGHRLAAEHAEQLLAEARLGADAERADASAKARAAVDQEGARQLEVAETEASRIRVSAEARLDTQVAAILAEVRARLAGLAQQ